MAPPKVNQKQKKEKNFKRFYELLSKHKQIVIVTLDNVGSNQIQKIRKVIQQGGGQLVIGKNTIIRKVIQYRANELPEDKRYDVYRQIQPKKPMKELENLLPHISQKIGLIFTDEAVFSLKPKIEENKISAAAKVGVIAPVDVTIPPGPTGMDPSQISFFHALQISTKIQKGQIEITKDYQVCFKGRKVGSSEVALLQKMNMRPFFYNMEVIKAYDDGSILEKEVISLSPEDIIAKFQNGVKNLTALSLQTNIPTELTVPNFILNGFKNLAAIGLQIDHKFKQLQGAQSHAPAAEHKEHAKKDDKKEEKPKKEEKVVEAPKEEEPEVDMGGLFDF